MTSAGEQTIADFVVLRRLGAGGMGEVFLVQHPRLPRRDALKLLDASVSRNEEFRNRFRREADVLAPLSHANITTLYDRGEWAGRLWLTMEYIAGQDANQLLDERGPLDPGLAIDIVAAAGAELDYAYAEHTVTHRDVKPANILVAFAADGRLKTVKLADFGIAKAASEATSLTSTGVTVGTMAYLSPEAIEGRALDNRADIYSLGCTAFQLLTGALPFTGNSIASLMSAHLSHPVPAITACARHLPNYLDDVFARVLAKNPDDRYRSCAQFVAALRTEPASASAALLDHGGVTLARAGTAPATFRAHGQPPSAQPAARRRSTGIAMATILIAVAGIAAAVAFATDFRKPRPISAPSTSVTSTPVSDAVKPLGATVYSPSGLADAPEQAGKAIDGDLATAWSTDTYAEPNPFPDFKEGVGLMLRLPAPTIVGAVTIDTSSTQTIIEIRSSPSADPAELSKTTLLAPPAELRPGYNTISIPASAPISNVLVWISALGITEGQNRADIREITIQAAA